MRQNGERTPVDARSPATMVGLLDWAYVRQRVRDARPDVPSGLIPSSWSTTGIVCRDLSAGAIIRGQGVYVPVAHPDAHTIDDFVLRLDSQERALVLHYAHTRGQPDWSPRLPSLVAVKVLKAGQPKTFKNGRGKPVGCFIEYEGFPPERAAAIHEHARRVYEAWHCALRILWNAMLSEDHLTRWRITGVGAEREPWQAREGVVL